MNADSAPVGTIVTFGPVEGPMVTLERVDVAHWSETNYHCVDCAEDYGHALVVDMIEAADSVTVQAVPAGWLTERLEALLPLGAPEDDQAIRDLAVDAGLS